MSVLETRLQTRMDAREAVHRKHEALLSEREGGELSDTDKSQITAYRSQLAELDTEIEQLVSDVEAAKRADEQSKAVRRAMLGSIEGTEGGEDGVVYRTMAAYARDYILTRNSGECSKIAAQFGNSDEIQAAHARMELIKRTPANTLSSNVGGLQPPQFIDQIFQVINKSRPLVDAASKTGLVRGQFTYPKVTTRPIVSVQASEKTEGGNQGMVVDLVTQTAKTYLGGGDLSWQAINWSTPDALQLWFDLAAADYALKTEQRAAKVMTDSAFGHIISSPLNSTPDFATIMTAVGAGYAKVFADSGRIADTVLLAPDRYAYLLGLTSTPQAIFANVGGSTIGPLKLLTSRGMDAGEIVVGDMSGFLTAETPGAPVELRVIEPAIGGLEVGLIGAFEAAVVDAGAFSLITTAS